MLNHSFGRGVASQFCRSECPLQKIDYRLGPQRMQIRLQSRRTFGFVTFTLECGNVPEIFRGIFHGCGALPIWLIHRCVNRCRPFLQRTLVSSIAIGYVDVKCTWECITFPGQDPDRRHQSSAWSHQSALRRGFRLRLQCCGTSLPRRKYVSRNRLVQRRLAR